MTKTLEEIMQNFTSEEQAEIQAEADKLISEEKAKREAIRQEIQKHPYYPYFVRDLKTRIDTQISQETYNELKKVHEKLIEVLFIEEKLDILLSNYFELEQTLLDLCLKRSYGNNGENQDNSFDELNLVDRRILNLLASCRMYIDQTAHSLSEIYGEESEKYIIVEGLRDKKTKKRIKKGIKSKICDSHFSYRLMEQIRNYSQHNGLLVSKIIPKDKWIEGKESDSLSLQCQSITITTKIDLLEEAMRREKIKKSVVEELKILEVEEFDLMNYIRNYIDLIKIIHLEIRKILKEDTEQWSKFYIDLIQKYKIHKKETGKTLVSFFRRDANSSEIIEQFDLIQDIIISRCQKLKEKNSNLDLPFIANPYLSCKIH